MSEVGDILWVLSLSRPGLKIYRITEQITKRTLNGTEDSFLLENLQSRKDRISLSDIDTEDFIITKSADEARDLMLKNASEAIERLIQKSQETIARKWTRSKEESVIEPSTKNTTEEMITLPDGRKAKANVKIPKELLDGGTNV
tara:strand:+ start:71 stop:502 length:432 start_codon:yes stop_codon:yes gene_type:complete